tara:strand:- start:319 stop:480 length:162 start_codon:yes stop_codon:yes gene_type:complete
LYVKLNTQKTSDKRIKAKNSIHDILVIPAGKPFNLKNKKGALYSIMSTFFIDQ